MNETKQLHLYSCNVPSSRYVFKNGKIANFIGGIYTTHIEQEIAELDFEVANDHPNIFVDPKRRVISADELDPMAVLKKKLRAELKAEMDAEAATGRDFGNSAQGKNQGLQTSATVAQVSSASNGAGIAAGSIKVPSQPK